MGALRDALLNLVCGQTAYTPPTSIIISLTTTAPSEGAAGTECAAADYARKTVTNNKTTWSTSSAGAGTLSNAIDFAWDAAENDWGTIVGGNLYAQDGTTRVAWFTLSTAKPVGIGDPFSIGAGDMDISLSAAS